MRKLTKEDYLHDSILQIDQLVAEMKKKSLSEEDREVVVGRLEKIKSEICGLYYTERRGENERD